MASETFKQRDWRPGSLRFLAVKITLSDPKTSRNSNYTTDPGASPVLYLCDAGSYLTVDAASGQNHPQGTGLLYNVDADAKFYYPLIEDWSIDCGSTGFGIDFADPVATLTLINHRYVFQRVHATGVIESDVQHVRLSQLFADYLWHGASVEFTICTEQFDYKQDPAAGAQYHEHEGQLVFTGQITSYDVDEKRIRIVCSEDREYDKTFPDSELPAGGSGPSIVDYKSYVYAPFQSIGAVIPLVFTRRGASQIFNNQYPTALNGRLLDALTPCVVTQFNSSTTHHIFMVADKWSAHGVAPSGTGATFWLDLGDGLLAALLGTTSTSTTEIDHRLSQADVANLYIPANRWRSPSGGTVTNPTYALQGKLDGWFATLTNSGSTATLDLFVPHLSNQGLISVFSTYVTIENTSAGGGATDATTAVEFGLWNHISGGGGWVLPTNNGGGKNPGVITKAEINALTTDTVFSSGQWTKGANEWNASDQPISQWRWEERNTGTGAAEEVSFRVRAITSGTTLKVMSGGILLRFNPSLSSDPSSQIRPRRTIKNDGRVVPGRTR